MSKQIESNPSRVSFDPRDVDMSNVDELADSRGVSRAELIRQTLSDELRKSDMIDSDNDLPSDLATAIETVRRDAVDGRVPVDHVESMISQQLKVPKDSVRRILKRLQSRDLIVPRSGVIYVREEAHV